MKYDELLNELIKCIPQKEYKEIISQCECELDFSFLGFIQVYNSILDFVPKYYTIIDLGCYLAAQSYFFKDYKQYIGVDSCDLIRFSPKNSKHYVKTIQEFINNDLPSLNLNLKTTFAICSFVPDDDAIELARKTFNNILVYYPAENDILIDEEEVYL